MPPDAPAFNALQPVWDELRVKCVHTRDFDSLEAVEDQLDIARRDLELDPERIQSMVAGPWIDALSNQKWKRRMPQRQRTAASARDRACACAQEQP
jgi:hypothetical protein